MKSSVLQESLHKAITTVLRVIPSHPQIPILSSLLIKAEKGSLTVVGSDLFTSVGLTIGGSVEQEGPVSIPARDFAAFVSNVPAGRVDLSVKEKVISVRSGRIKATFSLTEPEDFPDVWPKKKKGLEIPLSEFSSALRKVLFAAAQDESRPVLTGVLLSPRAAKSEEQGGYTLLATDGFRLSSVDFAQSVHGVEGPLIIPARMLHETLRVATGDRVTLGISDSGIAMWFEGGWVSSRVLAGTYPDVARIIPKESEVIVSMDRGELERAIRVVSVFAKGSANIVRWAIADGKLTVSANAPQVGEGEVSLDVDGKGSGPSGSAGREIAFNSRYLLDWVTSIDSERVEFGMTGPLKPGIFRPASPSQGGPVGDKTYTHVIMPVRVQKEEASG